MSTGFTDYRQPGDHDTGAGPPKRATDRAKIAAVKRFIPSISSGYDFRFSLPDGETVSTRCLDPDGRRTDIHLRDDVAVSAFLSMDHRRLYEAYTG
ncbi:MAG: hypothetical protein ACR2QK_06980, partial [Acidimicrobiales bacterium]